MASRPMYASMLPSVKCSSCGDDIMISMMGEHICTGSEEAEQTETLPDKPEAPRIPSSIIEEEEDEDEPTSHATDTSSGHRSKTSPVNPIVANGLRPPTAPLTPASTISQSSTLSQPTPPRSITDPLPSSTNPPSPPPDSDFLSAPSLKRSHTSSELDPKDGSRTITYTPKDMSYAPVSPRLPGATGLLQRMHTIAPGPFHLKKPSLKRPSVDRSRNSKDGNDQARLDHFGQPLPSGPPPPRPARPDVVDELIEDHSTGANDAPSGSLERGRKLDTQMDAPEPNKALPQRPRSRSRSATRSQSQSSSQLDSDTVPPLPSLSQLQSHSSSNHQHTPTESISSSGSRSMYDDRRTESSRSSPPTSHASGLSQRNLSIDEGNDRITSGSEYSVTGPSLLPSTTYQPRSSSLRQPPPQANGGLQGSNFSRPRPPEPLNLSGASPVVESPSSAESPLDPAMQHGLSPFPPRIESARALAGRDSNNRAPRPSKGECRECHQPITGRSIKDGSGRLSGRYHKECFVCKTCRDPFPTAEFYVFNDRPYCARHYHTLNRSLCASCNWGIEGSYLETDQRRKYHTSCFTCQDCRRPLPRDYFEISGRFYCEEDAMQLHQKIKAVAPGRRFPERRQTKLMMM